MEISTAGLRLSPGLSVERVGEDALIMNSTTKEVTHLSGEWARLVLAVSERNTVDTEARGSVGELIRLGILTRESRVTRRRVLGLGAAGLGATAVALSLPTAAAAASSIALSGLWANDSGTGRFYAVIEGVPQVNPGSLSVPGGTAAYVGVETYLGVTYLYWRQQSPTPPDNAPTTGSFLWDGVAYSVSFVYNLSLAQDIID